MANNLPFGFDDPGDSDFGFLGRRILEIAAHRIKHRSKKARLLLPAFLAVYLLFALALSVVFSAVSMTFEKPSFVALVTLGFVVMALLGQYYRGSASWAMMAGSLGRLHGLMLAQAFIVKTTTTLFFILPYRAFRNVADLFPRRAQVDPNVLEVAVQLTAALDDSITLGELSKIMPPSIGLPILEEAIVLLLSAGLIDNQNGMLVPADERTVLLQSLPQTSSSVTSISDLRRSAP